MRSPLKSLSLAVTTVLFLAVAVPASATTIGFEGVAPPGGQVIPLLPYGEAGFTFTTNGGLNGIFDSAAPGVHTNGTDIFGWCSVDCGVAQVITLTGPGPFEISSIDISYLFANTFAPGMSVQLTGIFAGGGSIVANLPVTSAWVTHALAGFTGLASLQLRAPGATDNLDPAIDNLVVQAVPEPVSLLLVATGGGLIAARRRRAALRT